MFKVLYSKSNVFKMPFNRFFIPSSKGVFALESDSINTFFRIQHAKELAIKHFKLSYFPGLFGLFSLYISIDCFFLAFLQKKVEVQFDAKERYQSIVFFSPSSKFVFALKPNSFSALDKSNMRRG